MGARGKKSLALTLSAPMGEREVLGGRVSWQAIALAGSCPIRLGGSLALPISVGFEFFHTFCVAEGRVGECMGIFSQLQGAIVIHRTRS